MCPVISTEKLERDKRKAQHEADMALLRKPIEGLLLLEMDRQRLRNLDRMIHIALSRFNAERAKTRRAKKRIREGKPMLKKLILAQQKDARS